MTYVIVPLCHHLAVNAGCVCVVATRPCASASINACLVLSLRALWDLRELGHAQHVALKALLRYNSKGTLARGLVVVADFPPLELRKGDRL